MRYFPAFFNLSGRRALVVGDGEAAVRKARLLLKAGANVVVVAQKPSSDLVDEVGSDAVARRAFRPADVDGCALVVAASEDETMDAAVAEAAREAGVPVNVVDRPELCDFITPSIVDRGDDVVGISTGGAAPVLGRRLRGQIEALAPRRLGELAAFARSFRGAAASKIEDGADRRRFWEETLRGPIGEKVLAGHMAAAREDMLVRLNSEGADPACGVVHIVGAGPGDPELLTLKALRVLQDADVILYDNLVDGAILDLARRDADRIYVGKKKSNHSVPQTDICDRLIALAREGKRVVRLKGGDPFIFGRGGEELEALKRAGVAAHV
ncbi:MAG: siroheme synthase CysG, partial [Pseudomonadota bacterium]